ncbi:MAG: hypothetical protein SNJ49_09135 [Chloracidobacterium sp.]
MRLIEVVEKLGRLDEESTIYASEPWTAESNAVVAPEPSEGGLPPEAEVQGLKYFLEVFIARDFVEDWSANLDADPTAQETCSRLIEYAVKDA